MYRSGILLVCISFSLHADALEDGARSLDRKTMANALLQKQAEPASSLLPQWLSGYAFLFDMEPCLQDLWLDLPEAAPASTESNPMTQPHGAAPGAKP
jgi:hypothetical protein